jgi:hypothetical protein
MTLGWNPSVVGCIDPKSTQMLQSRAPSLSSVDRTYVVRKFENGELFHKLADEDVREAVKTAVCNQGLILSLQTIAKDVRILRRRIHSPLTAFLGTMRRKVGDTIRRKTQHFFEELFDDLCVSEQQVAVVSVDERSRFAERCYQHLFLYMMRAERPKGSISKKQLETMACREFRHMYCAHQFDNIDDRNVSEADIDIRKPTMLPPDSPELADMQVEKRHGNSLFDGGASKGYMYLDQIRKPHDLEVQISASFLRKEIVNIFLFGAPPPLPYAPRASTRSASTLYRFPFQNEGSVSEWSTNYTVSLPSECGLSINEENLLTVPFRYPQYLDDPRTRKSPEAASVTESEWSYPDTRLRLEKVSKRRALQENTDVAEPDSKRRRLFAREAHLARYKSGPNEWSLTRQSSGDLQTWPTYGYVQPLSPRSLKNTSYGKMSVGSHVSMLQCSLPRSPTSSIFGADTSSVYSQSTWPIVPQQQHGPTTLEPDVTVSENANSTSFTDWGMNSRSSIQHYAENPTLTSRGRPGLKQVVSFEKWSKNPPIDPLETQLMSKIRSRAITFQSTKRDNLCYRAPADECSIERFVTNQQRIDSQSTFWYTVKGSYPKNAPTYRHLCSAIDRYALDTVLVDSAKLASTEHPDASAIARLSFYRPIPDRT